jgi:hypothetical protein
VDEWQVYRLNEPKAIAFWKDVINQENSGRTDINFCSKGETLTSAVAFGKTHKTSGRKFNYNENLRSIQKIV